MKKRYEYKGQIYCEDDLSEDIDNYAGDLFDLFWDLRIDWLVGETKRYYAVGSETEYETREEVIEEHFGYLEVHDG